MSDTAVRDRYSLVPFLIHPRKGGPFITIAWSMEQALAHAQEHYSPVPKEVKQISYPLQFADDKMNDLHKRLMQEAAQLRDVEGRAESQIKVRRMAKLHGVRLADE